MELAEVYRLSNNGLKALGDWAVAMVTKQKFLYRHKIFQFQTYYSTCPSLKSGLLTPI